MSEPVTPDENEEVFRSIGEFIVQFSKLEFLIRTLLAIYLKIDREDIADIVTASYDFASLCRITARIVELRSADKPEFPRYTAIFNGCLALNDERVRIAHGTWGFVEGTWHLSRNSLTPKFHYQDISEVRALTAKARKLLESLINMAPSKPI